MPDVVPPLTPDEIAAILTAIGAAGSGGAADATATAVSATVRGLTEWCGPELVNAGVLMATASAISLHAN